jgi:hypothetical protein
MLHEPSKSPLHHPVLGQHLKSLSIVAAFDHLHLQPWGLSLETSAFTALDMWLAIRKVRRVQRFGCCGWDWWGAHAVGGGDAPIPTLASVFHPLTGAGLCDVALGI